MTELIHLFMRPQDNDENVYVTSPQAAGLIFGRPTFAETRAEIPTVLEFHFDRPGPFDALEHHERHCDVAGGELVIRTALDEHRPEREVVYQRIRAALEIPEQAKSLLDVPLNKVGEAVYVCAVATDTIGWLADQLDPRSDDAFMIAVAVTDALLFTVAMASGSAAPDSIVAEPDMTVGEMIHRVGVVGPAPVSHPVIQIPA